MINKILVYFSSSILSNACQLVKELAVLRAVKRHSASVNPTYNKDFYNFIKIWIDPPLVKKFSLSLIPILVLELLLQPIFLQIK